MEWYGLFTRDRVGRGTIHIDAVTLSVLGGIQPGKLKWLTGDALEERRGDDGLLQRLQLLVWPDDPGPWVPPTARVEPNLRDAAVSAFERLDQMDDLLKVAARMGQVSVLTEDGSPYLRFDAEAQEMYDDWRNRLEHRLRSKELATAPAFEAHVAKYRSLMPSLALVFHLLDLS